MDRYCRHCGCELEGEIHIFEEMCFCDYDCLESYVVSNTEIYELEEELYELEDNYYEQSKM